jgi:hypothetical protein
MLMVPKRRFVPGLKALLGSICELKLLKPPEGIEFTKFAMLLQFPLWQELVTGLEPPNGAIENDRFSDFHGEKRVDSKGEETENSRK